MPLIADRAEELDYQLREINEQLTPTQELLDNEKVMEAQAEGIRQRALQSRDLLAGAPTPWELRDEQRYWRSRTEQYAQQRKLLNTRAGELGQQIAFLDAQQPEWQATWNQIHGIPAIEAVAKRVEQELEKIQATRLEAREQLNIVLTLQNQISQQDQQMSEILLRLVQSRDQERGHILQQDSLPLWKTREQRKADELGSAFHGSFNRSFTSAAEFFRAHTVSTLIVVLTYILLLAGILNFRRYVARADKSEVAPEALPVLKAPFSAALLVGLVGAGAYIDSAPIGVAFVFYLLYLVPVLRFLAPAIEVKARMLLYALAVFYALEGAYLLIRLPELFRREIYAGLVLAAVVCLGWLARPSRMFSPLPQDRKLRMLMIGISTDLLLLWGSFIANIVGFFSLAQILGTTALIGPFVAVVLYCAVRVLSVLLTALLRMHGARLVLEIHVDTVRTWGRRFLGAAAYILWLKVMLQLLTIYDRVTNAVLQLLYRPIGFEKVYFTLMGAFRIAVILLGGYVFANAIILLLRKIVFPKLPLKRGVPYAFSRITYYFLLLLICLSALSAADVELNRFTLLSGALGVGLGFGLQNIVNNFVSGLILLVERPIHVGDTVDVGGLVGTVRRIGARSSTVLTYQGAEVIVPNSNLLSNQVINWTLSSQWRRVDVPVRVAYGTDPERVIELLIEVAKSHREILLERPPNAFFMGFGEDALNFELRFWCAHQDTWFQLQSDVTVAVAKALRAAGIEVPFPQRDLHVRSIEASAAETFAGAGARTVPSSSERDKQHSHV